MKGCVAALFQNADQTVDEPGHTIRAFFVQSCTVGIGLSLIFVSCSRVLGADFAVPAATGNSADPYPFRVDSMRYQQVYGAPAFPSLTPVGGGWITAIQFNRVSGAFALNFTANFQINFSTTSRAVDGLSTTFADNEGSDNRVAFGPADVAFQPGQPGPLGFSAPTIQLTTPFFYNPGNGNLLMEVRMFHGLGVGSDPFNPVEFNASNLPTDQTSRIANFGSDSVTGIAESVGLITGFRITPAVPEPSSTALVVAAVVVFSLFGLRKNKQPEKEIIQGRRKGCPRHTARNLGRELHHARLVEKE